MLPALQRAHTPHGAVEVIETEGGFFKEALSRRRGSDAGMVALEELRLQTVLKALDPPADGGVLDVQCSGRSTKAAMFSGCQSIPEQSKV